MGENATTVLLANILNVNKINIISSAEGGYGECHGTGVAPVIKMTPRRSENALALTINSSPQI